MFELFGPGTLGSSVLFVLTVVLSLTALYGQPQILERYVFRPYLVSRKQRLDTLYMSGFLHGSLAHLLFNMVSFYFFAPSIEQQLGTFWFLALYFLALIVSSLPTLYKHRDNPAYASLGASGAVLAVVFAFVLYFPTASFFILPIPIPIPAPIFAIAFAGYSWWASRRAAGNINHDAHLMGAAFGLFFVAVVDWPTFSGFWRFLFSYLS